MIIRVMGEGQYHLADSQMDQLNELDETLTRSVESADEAAFRAALGELCGAVSRDGERLQDDSLEVSDYVLPSPDSSLEEVKALLGDEGLLPG